MALMIFSEPQHVRKIWDGSKPQTSRLPRKIPVKVGELLHCYYRSRMKRSCTTCVKRDCDSSIFGKETTLPGTVCALHTHYIGVATATEVLRVRPGSMDAAWKEIWAKLDGFASFAEADQWFVAHHGENWQDKELDVIKFDGHWLMKPSPESCGPCKNYTPTTPLPSTWEKDNTCGIRGINVYNMQHCPLGITL